MNEHAPGWYEHHGERRYWDGSRWTHSTSVPPTSPGTALSAPPFAGQAPPFVGRPGPVPVARKEPWLSLLVSFLIPGVGSMINGDVGVGTALLGIYVLGVVLTVCLGWLIVGLIGVPIALIAWAGSMYHAYKGAVDFNIAAGYPS